MQNQLDELQKQLQMIQNLPPEKLEQIKQNLEKQGHNMNFVNKQILQKVQQNLDQHKQKQPTQYMPKLSNEQLKSGKDIFKRMSPIALQAIFDTMHTADSRLIIELFKKQGVNITTKQLEELKDQMTPQLLGKMQQYVKEPHQGKIKRKQEISTEENFLKLVSIIVCIIGIVIAIIIFYL